MVTKSRRDDFFYFKLFKFQIQTYLRSVKDVRFLKYIALLHSTKSIDAEIY